MVISIMLTNTIEFTIDKLIKKAFTLYSDMPIDDIFDIENTPFELLENVVAGIEESIRDIQEIDFYVSTRQPKITIGFER